jgi:hypothetical protein
MARKEPVDVTTTLPDASPEYILSLSPDTESALIGEECERSICCGVGGGGAADIGLSSDQPLLPNMTKCVGKYVSSVCLSPNNMHSILTRLNNGSAFMSSCVMALLVAIALTTFLFNPNLQGDLTISSINVFVRLPDLDPWKILYKKFIAFPLKHDDILIVNKTSLSLISTLPQVCRIFPLFFSDQTQK